MPTKTKPITEFSETCNGPNSRNKWLGISRLSRIPDAGWPSRESCQKAVTAEELAAGAKIVAEYRENEQITVDHDADSRQREISACHQVAMALIMPDCAKNLRLVALRYF